MSKLIPIVDAVKRNRERREIDPDKIDSWHKAVYNSKGPHHKSVRLIQQWIDKFTKGRFFLAVSIVAFEDEEDFTIFKLWYKEE